MERENSKRRKIQESTENNDTFSIYKSPFAANYIEDGENLMENFIPQCSVITGTIYQYLSAKDLLNVSRVSKNWFLSSREYLKKHEKDLHIPLCLDKTDDVEMLERIITVLDKPILDRTHPFTGLHFKFTPENNFLFEAPSAENWHKSMMKENQIIRLLRHIFNKLPMLHFYISKNIGEEKVQANHDFLRIMMLLPLPKIEYLCTNLSIFELLYSIRTSQFPNLKTICIDERMGFDALFALDLLFTACPALETWTSPIPANLVETFQMKNKNFLIKSLVLRRHNSVAAIINENLMLKELVVTPGAVKKYNIPYEHIIRLLQNNSSTLRVIQITDSLVSYFADTDFEPMTNVRKVYVTNFSEDTKKNALIKFPNAIAVDGTNRCVYDCLKCLC